MKSLKYNKTIITILNSSGIPLDDGLTVLTLLYCNLYKSKVFEDEYFNSILSILGTKFIFNMDFETKKIKWLIPLFGEDDEDWVTKFMDMFKQVNPSRRGVRAEVIQRMKNFRIKYPEYTMKEIFDATEYYLNNLNNMEYCKSSHKFIQDMNGSVLLDHLEYLKNQNEGIDDVI